MRVQLHLTRSPIEAAPPTGFSSQVEIDDSALGHLAALFSLPSGGEVVDEKLCAWLLKILEGESTEPSSVEE